MDFSLIPEEAFWRRPGKEIEGGRGGRGGGSSLPACLSIPSGSQDPLLSTLHMESDLEVAERAYDFMLWLRNRSETEIVVSTHSAPCRCDFWPSKARRKNVLKHTESRDSRRKRPRDPVI